MITQTFSIQPQTYNPCQLDAYLLHLAGLNEFCDVFFTEDIYNNQNELLATSGQRITSALAHRIIRFKLSKPLDESICITSELDAIRLENDFMNVMRQDEILLAINEYFDFSGLLKLFCQNVTAVPLFRKKLTVMMYAMPDIYQRSLYCAWLTLLIAKEMRLSREDIYTAFVAATMHDIGMLHIDTEIINQKILRTSEQWLHVQNHALIGSKIVSLITCVQPAVSQAIYEHHERCDGTGYPLGKVESELCLLGQIVGLADSVMAIYHNRFKEQNLSWRDAVPVIQMNIQAYLYRAYEVLVTILRRSELPQKNVVNGNATPEFVVNLVKRNEQLKHWFESMRDSIMSAGFRHGDRQLHALQNIMLHVSTSADGSGIFKKRHELLLDVINSHSEQALYQEIESMHLMQQEVTFHLQRLNRMTQLYLDSGECKKEEIKLVLISGLKRTQQYLL